MVSSPFSPGATPIVGNTALNWGLLLHGVFECVIGLLLLIEPSVIFPWIASRVLYSNQERSILRWFAFNIILQGGIAGTAYLNFDIHGKKAILTAFLGYHFAVAADSGYAFLLEGDTDEAALGLHTVMMFIIGYLLYSGSRKVGKKAQKGR